MKESLRKTVAAALGLATIYLVWIAEPLLKATHNAIYHWDGGLFNLFGAVILDMLVLWVVLAMLLLPARKPGRWRVVVWGAAVLFTPSIAIKSIAFLGIWKPYHPLTLAIFGIAIVVYLLIVLFWRLEFVRTFDRMVGFASTVLGFVGIAGGVILCQLAWFGFEARALNKPGPVQQRQMAVRDETKPRIIWILLDELSYQQIYERRFDGLQLPAFDSLAAQGTVFTHAITAISATDKDIRTEKILPSLLTGTQVDQMRSSASGQLSVHDANTHAWRQFNQHDTVFQDAFNAGYSTAVAGWYNPYCRMMPAVLDHCFWTVAEPIENGMAPGKTLMANMLQPIIVLVEMTSLQRFLKNFMQTNYVDLTEDHIADYRSLSEAADESLTDKSRGFIFIHVPVPHPGGIYDRRTGQLTTGASSYIDNMALADKYLAHVRSMLEKDGQWDASTIVVMGDHSWRTMSWKESPDEWMPEDAIASRGGQFDARPAYIVKLAGQHKGGTIDTPFHALETRPLMDALLMGKIRSEEDLVAWVRQAH